MWHYVIELQKEATILAIKKTLNFFYRPLLQVQ